jgi:hypothetical protein
MGRARASSLSGNRSRVPVERMVNEQLRSRPGEDFLVACRKENISRSKGSFLGAMNQSRLTNSTGPLVTGNELSATGH